MSCLKNSEESVFSRRKFLNKSISIAAFSALVMGSGTSPSISTISKVFANTEFLREANGVSNIYCVGGFRGLESGRHIGLGKLFTLMGSHGLKLLKSSNVGTINGPDGLISQDDIVLTKINCQWPERGGTNTDLVRELIQTIVGHPEGFTGEIVVVDNGQGRGSFEWDNANAEDTTQCIQDAVDSFSNDRISTYLWDDIRSNRTQEYNLGAMDDGYILEDIPEPFTGMKFNYPKFRTSFGTYISLKHGTWNPDSDSYSNENLKLINFPVLKSHSSAGVTACIKHYMGVISQSVQDNHSYIWNGGLAAEMAQIRFPILNILDAIYVNPHPKESGNSGPSTPYSRAVKINKIAAGLDPVAIDYWSSKNILIPVAESLGYSSYSSLDPDTYNGTFHNTLENSANTIQSAGFQATMNPSQIVIHSLYPSINENILNYTSQPSNNAYFIYPDYEGDKPPGTSYAKLSDWTAAGYVIGMCSNIQIEATDTNSGIIDSNNGSPKLTNKTIVLFGGPIVNTPVRYYENSRIAPVYYRNVGGVNYWYRADGTRLDETALTFSQINAGQDMFVVETFIDAGDNLVLIIYGYGWKGTYAGGKFFKFMIYPNIESYSNSYYIFKWNDENKDGFVDLSEISLTPIAQG